MSEINTPKMYELDQVSDSVVAAIPPRIREGLDRYACYGVPTGDFLQAVLSNNLMLAVGRADKDSLAAIQPICQYVHNALPGVCHGSPEKVKAHIEAGRKHLVDFQSHPPSISRP